MGGPHEQADGNQFRPRGYARKRAYHRWLKRGHARLARRLVRLMLRRGEEDPPPKIGYRGWEL